MTKAQKTSNGCAPLLLACLGLALVAFGIVATLRVLQRGRDETPEPVERFRVQSRSMEPTFCGPRFALRCPECNATFSVALDVDPARGATGNLDSPEARDFRERARFAACPECGFDRVPTSDATFNDGELVDADPDANASIERWDVAVFRDASGRRALKRVVGFPGERVAIRNGDLCVNGALERRSWEQIWSTAASVGATEIKRDGERTTITRVLRSRDPNGNARSTPTSISNESPIPAWNGANAAPVEFARDFFLEFQWLARDGAPCRFGVLARRPTRAWLVELDSERATIDVASTPLYNGRARSGRDFAELTRADFAREERTQFEWRRYDLRADRNYAIQLAIVDGELILCVDGLECARVETNDLDDPSIGVAVPFVLLGDATRVTTPRILRDLHYSSARDASPETVVPQGHFYVLGDNSPASRDSRFADVGCVVLSGALVKRDERP